ncbi:glycosyltransferase family 4 protein [Microbacterium flavescens]|uniref:glycosyltransferase family 4 protein n=1 Tax=Microbacterium flavescens TaxID=69366 RepID=UPI001BDE11B5|nr:glycosyltransferase family 1 protein [Microbacterium flavescens]
MTELMGVKLPAVRLATLADALGKPLPAGHDDEAVAAIVDPADWSQVWLALAVLSGRLPDEAVVTRVAREAEFEPLGLAKAIVAQLPPGNAVRSVRVVTNVVVDVGNTAAASFTTGIQRVVRETVSRWMATQDDVLPVAWTADFGAMRTLTRSEAASFGVDDPGLPIAPEDADLVVPWRAVMTTAELAAEPERSTRMRALSRFSGNPSGSIAYDLVPVVAAETTAAGMSDVFARHLTALRYNRRIATISHSVADEYEGWKSGLRAIGMAGPDVVGVPLPVVAGVASDDGFAQARQQLVVEPWPMVLVVGSHEPRKNHLPLLEAAEKLWSEGLCFSLAFIGGRSWGGAEFASRAGGLVAAGRPLRIVAGASDDVIWAAYRLARFTMFPSFYEGFGLPVAESLASGTPCITSGFGSMKEIAEGGGAILVNAYSDDDIREKMRLLLTDDALIQRLRAEAAARSPRTWDDYATDLWDELVVPLRPECRRWSEEGRRDRSAAS